MRSTFSFMLIFCFAIASGRCADSASPQREYTANPCLKAPNIDGKEEAGEWDQAVRYRVPITMGSSGQTSPTTVTADLWLMNSASQLFLALRMPDDDKQASLQPFNFDLVVLEFCRGDQLAEGDDKKMVVPGIYADKHYVGPGKDANDKVQSGKAVMNYSGQDTDGFYFIEMAMPLDSGDGEDLAAKPGQSIKFNLIYVDGFETDNGKMMAGGLFGPDIETANNWGYLKLADTNTEAEPAAAPAWLEALFPYTGTPDEFNHRFQRTESTTLDVDGRQGGQVTCNFIYPEIDGSVTTGTVIFFLPPELEAEPGKRVPFLHVAGYEIDANGAMGYLKEGIAVSTVHAHPLNPLARGPKLEWALLHAERRLPFVDDAHVFIQGGSAGGYMTLMTSAETFPIVCAMPTVPPVNWTYNAAYIAKSKEMAFSHREGSEEPWLPFTGAVHVIVEQAQARFGVDTEADDYFQLSPIQFINSITAPMQVVFSTADMLVPIDQVSKQFIRPFDPTLFPEGFTHDMDAILTNSDQRLRLLDVMTSGSYEVFMENVPEGAVKYKADGTLDGEGKSLKMPFSRDQQWSIIIIDEGAPEPQVGHFKYGIIPDTNAFWHWALDHGVQPDQLTKDKLALLMKRYQGIQPLDFMVNPADGPAHKAQLLDFPRAEKADVLRGLATFARDDTAATRLAELYTSLPEELKPFGDTLGDGTAEAVRNVIDKAATALEN